jgi:hypothetical protein
MLSNAGHTPGVKSTLTPGLPTSRMVPLSTVLRVCRSVWAFNLN